MKFFQGMILCLIGGGLTSITFTDLSFAFNIIMHFLGFVLVFDGLIRMMKVIKKE